MSNENFRDRFDVIIVGAGSAGCVVASRLSENPHLEVLLLEAGGDGRGRWIDIPIGYYKTVGDPRYDWKFATVPEKDLNKRSVPFPRGKGLGGTSLINGMLYLRGHRRDYDNWAALGNSGWNWSSVLPYFNKSLVDSSDPSRCIGIETSALSRDELSDAFIASAKACGIRQIRDFNEGDNAGASYFTMTTKSGRRVSTARGYLLPASKRPNLTIMTASLVTRLLTHAGRAVGVEVIAGGQRRIFRANDQVVVSCGAIQSPQLLQISGIGDPEHLSALSINVTSPLPGVGKNLQDHLQIRPTYQIRGVETLNEIANSRWRSLREYLRYTLTKAGSLNDGVFRAGAFFSTERDGCWPDTQIHFGPLSFDDRNKPLHPFPGVTISYCNLRPTSRGTVKIQSTNATQAPAIEPKYLSTEFDRRKAVEAFWRVREIVNARPLAEYIVREHEPGKRITCSDELVLSWVRDRASSIFHPVGTCAMGPEGDPDAVVDSELRVRGIDALRVVDGSIMPQIVSGNTNAPIIMIAEKAAASIRSEIAS